jgi:aryl-alcohol dehydrogenase-like predicted oxidoreductase
MQNHYNLMYREEEREMLPLCREEGIGVIPWSPLARGRLARPWDTPSTLRAQTDAFSKKIYMATEQADQQVVEAVGKVAQAHGKPYAQIALAWLLLQSGVTAPIVGASRQQHLEDALGALDVVLSDDDIATLEAPYAPHPVAGFG